MSSMLKAVSAAVFSLASMGLLFSSASAEADSNNSSANPQWNLMLVGSELQICSSMNAQHCNSNEWIVANDMRTARLFQLTDVRRREALRQAIWPRERDGVREELDIAMREMVDYFGRGVVPEQRLVERLRSRAYLELVMRLSDAEYNRILDNIEMPRLEGLNEVVNLNETKSNSAEFIRNFVAMAEQLKGNATERTDAANILVVTAGERDSFRNIDTYLGAFTQAGANAQWLPIDIAVTALQQNGGENACRGLESQRRELSGSYDRDRVNPQRHAEQQAFCNDKDAWQALLANADGVFFTGGSADKLRRVLLPNGEATPVLRGLRERFDAGNLAVGGAGAGAQALVSANMITNGRSGEGMRSGAIASGAPAAGCEFDNTCPRGLNQHSLTYEPLGGVGVYRIGIVDTDVSMRGRQARMLRVAAETNTPLAMGIDANTAVLMNSRSGVFSVIGDEGALFLEGAQQVGTMLAATFHYLRTGSMGRMAGSRVSAVVMAEQPPMRLETTTNRFLDDTGFYDNFDVVCRGNRQLRLLQSEFQLVLQATDASELELSRSRCQVYNGVIGISQVEP
ncbi:cyanophycinase [Aliidiomarina sp.]|uniref:cyanophycinase n=1 Tax=Aliidiomarina sp. TaxID=1872439 RepID=UPI003A4D8601